MIASCSQDGTPLQREDQPQRETLPFYNTADFDAEWIDKEDPRHREIHTIATFSLQDQLGNTVTNETLSDSIYVANFFFTGCPGICPTMANNLKDLQERFSANPEVKVVSFSVMPWVDSVQRLHEYAEDHGVDPARWHLLTGDKEEIYHLARSSFFAEKSLGLSKTSDEFLHTETMLLIDKAGRIRGIYNATQRADVERVADDIGVLLKE